MFKNIFYVRKWAGNCVTKISQHKLLSGLTFARQKLFHCYALQHLSLFKAYFGAMASYMKKSFLQALFSPKYEKDMQ